MLLGLDNGAISHEYLCVLCVLLLCGTDCKDHEETVNTTETTRAESVELSDRSEGFGAECWNQVPELRWTTIFFILEERRISSGNHRPARTRKPWEVQATRAYGGRSARSTF